MHSFSCFHAEQRCNAAQFSKRSRNRIVLAHDNEVRTAGVSLKKQNLLLRPVFTFHQGMKAQFLLHMILQFDNAPNIPIQQREKRGKFLGSHLHQQPNLRWPEKHWHPPARNFLCLLSTFLTPYHKK